MIPEVIEQKYYTISQVSDIINQPVSAIRYWLDKFELAPIRHGTDRRINAKDIDKLKYIVYLLKVRKFTIKGAILELKSNGWKKASITETDTLTTNENIYEKNKSKPGRIRSLKRVELGC